MDRGKYVAFNFNARDIYWPSKCDKNSCNPDVNKASMNTKEGRNIGSMQILWASMECDTNHFLSRLI